ncbi:hypothetical protein UlMin_041202 [Ulmus minor]
MKLDFTGVGNGDVHAERDPVFGHITHSHKPASKSFDYNYNSLDSTELKSGNIVKEEENRLLCDLKDNNGDAARLQNLMTNQDELAASKLDSFENTDDLKAQKAYQVKDFVAPFTDSSFEVSSLGKDSHYCMDNSCMECELPEFRVCYKESNHSAVKDICVDEGVRSKDKILFGGDVDEKGLCTFLFPDTDQSKQVIKEQFEISNPFLDGWKSSEKSDSGKEYVDHSESKDLVLEDEIKNVATDKIANDISNNELNPGNVLLGHLLGMDDSLRRSSWDENAAAQKTSQISSDNASEVPNTDRVSTSSDSTDEKINSSSEEASTSPAAVSGAEESTNQGNNNRGTIVKEQISETSTAKCLETEVMSRVDDGPIDTQVVSSQDQHDSSSPSTLPGDHHSQNGSSRYNKTPTTTTIEEETSETLTVSSKAQHESTKEECSQNGVCESCHETPKTSSPDGATSEIENASSEVQHVVARDEILQNVAPNASIIEDGIFGTQNISGQFIYTQGECSFSAAGAMSGRINYSGPIPYSGSISLRSDSSTTSTRSFAFPVLQTEWNSSPVRMAKADRRFRKHSGWKHGLLCCKF